jgi:hypothetical protein
MRDERGCRAQPGSRQLRRHGGGLRDGYHGTATAGSEGGPPRDQHSDDDHQSTFYAVAGTPTALAVAAILLLDGRVAIAQRQPSEAVNQGSGPGAEAAIVIDGPAAPVAPAGRGPLEDATHQLHRDARQTRHPAAQHHRCDVHQPLGLVAGARRVERRLRSRGVVSFFQNVNLGGYYARSDTEGLTREQRQLLDTRRLRRGPLRRPGAAANESDIRREIVPDLHALRRHHHRVRLYRRAGVDSSSSGRSSPTFRSTT